jgi:hypothetical protein
MGLGTYQFWDHADLHISSDLSLFIDYAGPSQSGVNLRLARGMDRYQGVEYEFPLVALSTQIRPGGALLLGLESQFGGTIDYANGRRADQTVLAPFVLFTPGRHWSIHLSDSYQRLAAADTRLFTVNLVRLRLAYHFNVRTYTRLILQYRTLDRNVDNYLFPVDPKDRSLFSQFLYSYKINPQTVFYLGYSENSQGGVFGLTPTRVDLTTTNRTFFMKLGYALMF